MTAGQEPRVQCSVVDVQDAPVGIGEDRAGGHVAAELLAGGEVSSGVEEVENGGEVGFVLGVGVEVGGEGGADVVCRDGQVDHLLK